MLYHVFLPFLYICILDWDVCPSDRPCVTCVSTPFFFSNQANIYTGVHIFLFDQLVKSMHIFSPIDLRFKMAKKGWTYTPDLISNERSRTRIVIELLGSVCVNVPHFFLQLLFIKTYFCLRRLPYEIPTVTWIVVLENFPNSDVT